MCKRVGCTRVVTKKRVVSDCPEALKDKLAERTLAREQAATQVLKARIEDYPEMKNHEVVGRFMAIMADTESYLALLRNSYTDSAMIYNTRIQTLPDLLLAWLFRFRPVSQFSKDGS